MAMDRLQPFMRSSVLSIRLLDWRRSLSWGEIPVVRFDIPEMDAGDFIRHAFRRMSVRLVIQDLGDQALMVSEPSSAQADEARGSKPL